MCLTAGAILALGNIQVPTEGLRNDWHKLGHQQPRGEASPDGWAHYDVDAAQHLLADHADRVIVAFDYDATDPRVFIYTQTPDGVLSGSVPSSSVKARHPF